MAGDTCHVGSCQNVSEQDCNKCEEPTCGRHLRSIGGRRVCVNCIDEADA
jgi:formylmethanofuran dehydrogenase subunit E